jgi:hypothetical protein
MNFPSSIGRATNRFFKLPLEEKRLLIQAIILLWAVRLGLWVLPYSRLNRIIEKATYASVGTEGIKSRPLNKLTWSIEAMSRYVPNATCLTKALAAKMLLAKDGYSSSLCIGVVKDEENNFEAHAWLKHQGLIILGKSDRNYAELPSFDEQYL